MNRISVIVPVYNSEKTIRRCIDSILRQTYENFEILCVDDCSSDSSRDIISEYARRDSRVRLFPKEHGGVSAARNFGITKADGDFIQFIDSDDWIEPEMFETMLDMSLRDNADVVCCNYIHPCIKNYLGDRVLDFSDNRDILTFSQNTFAMVVPWNKLFRKEVITEGFDTEVAFCEDELFFVANMKNIKRLISTDKVLYNYYAAPPTQDIEKCSCITKIARDPRFWLNKATYWYRRRDMQERCRRAMEGSFSEAFIEEQLRIRMFDFMIWELIIFSSLDVNRQGLVWEMQSIFSETDFITSLCGKEKYGYRYICYPKTVLDIKVEQFVGECMAALDDMRENSLDIRLYYVFSGLFAKYFLTQTGPFDTHDMLAKIMDDMANDTGVDAAYINSTEPVRLIAR